MSWCTSQSFLLVFLLHFPFLLQFHLASHSGVNNSDLARQSDLAASSVLIANTTRISIHVIANLFTYFAARLNVCKLG